MLPLLADLPVPIVLRGYMFMLVWPTSKTEREVFKEACAADVLGRHPRDYEPHRQYFLDVMRRPAEARPEPDWADVCRRLQRVPAVFELTVVDIGIPDGWACKYSAATRQQARMLGRLLADGLADRLMRPLH